VNVFICHKEFFLLRLIGNVTSAKSRVTVTLALGPKEKQIKG
jgi:hypothetical protein